MGQKMTLLCHFLVQFSVNLRSNAILFVTSRKKDPILKWTIYKYESYKNKRFLSVGNVGILSLAHSRPTPAYVEFILAIVLVQKCHKQAPIIFTLGSEI